jgi:ferredoxin
MAMKNLKNSSTLKIDKKKCIGCGLCTEVCPHAALYLENRNVHIRDIDVCMECGGCSKNCPVGAITVRAGVGCAAAIISSKFGKSGTCTCG